MPRRAHATESLLEQVNAQWPNRNKDNDGWIGDDAHQARKSDHNPDIYGIVRAQDITHDPAHGFDSYKFANLILNKQDPRLAYVISNRRIGSGPRGPEPGVWRKYTGTNPHDHHVHISVLGRQQSGDDPGDREGPWDLDGMTIVADAAGWVEPPPTVKPGAANSAVEKMQKALGIKVTGQYAARSETEYALRLFQVRHGLDPDGVCGPQTWKALAPATDPA